MNVRRHAKTQSPKEGAPGRLAHSVENAARRLDVGRTTIFHLIRSGRLRAVKLNGRTLVPDDALCALLADLPPAA